ncbi:MAG: hypothetical protein HYV08_14495, partial [Deltaproteobacteria bacterium]|nr:hypothetical protein [Deltaproteobacteria bacterium]
MISRRRTRAGDWLSILFLIALPLVAFSPLTLGRALPFFGDVIQQAYPYRQLAVSLLAAGELPLWNPFTMAGVPLLANIQVGALYPPHVLPFLVLPFDVAFGLQSVLPLVLAGLGMYAYLRSLGLLLLPALIGGVVFSFSGPVVHKLQLPPVLEMTALIP